VSCPHKRGKVRVTVDIDRNLFVILTQRYGDVEELILNALRQLANADDTNTYTVIQDIMRLHELNETIFQIERQALRIVSALAERDRMQEIPSPFKEIIDTTLALRVQILYDMLKRLRKLKIPPTYRSKVNELIKKCRFFLIEWRSQRRKDFDYERMEAEMNNDIGDSNAY